MNAYFDGLLMRYLSIKVVVKDLSDRLQKYKVTLENLEAEIKDQFMPKNTEMTKLKKIQLFDGFHQPFKIVLIPDSEVEPTIIKYQNKFYRLVDGNYIESYMIEASQDTKNKP